MRSYNMAKYKITKSPLTNEITGFIDQENNVIFPADESNRHYQEYLEWTKASPMNVAEPADEEAE